MNRISVYQYRFSKIVSVGQRNIDAYYIVLKAEKTPIKLISKAMRIEEGIQDSLTSEVEIKPNKLEIWNYDKMKLVEVFPIDFKTQPTYVITVHQDNLELTIERENAWEK